MWFFLRESCHSTGSNVFSCVKHIITSLTKLVSHFLIEEVELEQIQETN
jgi:hypothetical protein